MKKVLSAILTITLVLSVNVGIVLPAKVAANTVTNTKITIDNTNTSNKIKYIPYSLYPGIGTTLTDESTGKHWWPKLSEGCPTQLTTKFKTLPWLPENDGLGLTDNYTDGNTFTTSGNCDGRYRDGGKPTGAWLTDDAYAGWTNAGVLDWKETATATSDFEDSAYSAKLHTFTTGTNDLSDNFPDTQIWGTSTLGSTDHSVIMFQKNGFTAYTPTKNGFPDYWNLFSSGTTLFRNEFTLTASQTANLNTVNLYAVADDWVKVYIDGTAIASTSISKADDATGSLEKIDLVNNSIIKTILKSNPPDPGGVKSHVIAFQVNDKARWLQGTTNVSGSNKTGLSYKMELNLSTPPPATPPTCTVAPVSGETPLVVKVSVINGIPPYPPYDFDMNYIAGQSESSIIYEYPNRNSPVYYTYPTGGEYTIRVRDNSATPLYGTCALIKVKNPTNTGGGEVAP